MDSKQFDDISRKLAGRSTRREAVRTGGLMAAVAGAFGVRTVARAQDEDEPIECTWAFKALVTDGPNRDATYEGELKVNIERDGAIDNGTFETEGADPYDVVGNTRGKVLSFRIKISSKLALAMTGVGERDIKSCKGQIDGTFAGPEFGDIGVWQIQRPPRNETGDGTVTATATESSGGPGDPEPTSSSGDPNPTSTPNVQATSTPCTPEDCGVTKMWDPAQCMCVCYDNGVDCGPNTCCPQGSICLGGGGGCSCPSGTVVCGNACVDDCSGDPGTYLDYNTCTCVQGCPSGQVLCNNNCVSCDADQKLNTSTCVCEDLCPVGQAFCSGVCTDIVNSINNCGSCGNVCPAGMPCIAGSCICPATTKYCASEQKCKDENLACN